MVHDFVLPMFSWVPPNQTRWSWMHGATWQHLVYVQYQSSYPCMKVIDRIQIKNQKPFDPWYRYDQLRQGVDIGKDAALHNLSLTMGLLFGIRQILRVMEGGLCTLALPCNSFGFMSSSQHQRSTEAPWGNLHYGFVWQGNNLAARTALLWCLCIARSVLTLLENPDRSRVADIPFFVQLMNLAEICPQHIKWLLALNLWYSLSELYDDLINL